MQSQKSAFNTDLDRRTGHYSVPLLRWAQSGLGDRVNLGKVHRTIVQAPSKWKNVGQGVDAENDELW